MERQAIVSELIGQSYPSGVVVNDGRLRRSWIARVAGLLPDEASLADIQKEIEGDACMAVTEAYAEFTEPEGLERAKPTVSLLRLDDHHLVVQTEFADDEHSVGNAAAIAQWGVLQRLDQKIRLEELQGIPHDLWFFLRITGGP